MSTPNLHIFNPSCETAIANGTVSYLPNKTLLKFENDLAYLPSLLSKSNDLILTKEYEDLSHIELLHSLSFPVPGQILQKDFFENHQKIISEINDYKLWGWAPNWIHRLKKNNTVTSYSFEKSEFYNWQKKHKTLYSRTTAKTVLESIIKTNQTSIYISNDKVPKVLFSVNEIERFLNKHKQIVLKEAWSSSGRGIIMLRKDTLNTSIIQRIKGILNQQEYIMAEPLLNKKLDMAMHFEIKSKRIHFKGETFFQTNTNGQYQANFLNIFPKVKTRILHFISAHKEEVQANLRKAIKDSDIFRYYEGSLGVDIMIIEQENKLFFQPCVEINLRNNMGTIALEIQKIIHPEAKGSLHIVFNPRQNYESIYNTNYIKLSTLDNRIIKGTLSLISPKEKQFGAYIKLE